MLEGLKANTKIHESSELLEPFEQGAEKVDVIVTVLPSNAAKKLAEKSALNSETAEEWRAAGGPVFYDLEDRDIQQQLRQTVKETLDDFTSQLDAAQITVKRKFEYLFGFSAEVTLQGLTQLSNDPNVVSIEQNRILYPHLAQGIPLMNATSARGSYNGSGLAIAICDTGIDTSHPRLGGGGFPNAKVIGGYDTGDSDADPRPSLESGNAHGTACAGIAAGDLGTTGDYIGGVAPAAKLYALKISTGTSGSASTDAMIAAWEWSITHKNDDPAHPIMIISTSFGGGRYYSTCDSASTGMTTAAANAVAAGITIFVSSGNDGYCDSMGWPACISYVNSVGAVYDSNFDDYTPCVNADSCAPKIATGGCSTGYYSIDATAADKVTSYSNSASFLTLFAPANAASTTDITGTWGYSTGSYTTSFGGTSAACPYAAGAAAVLQHAAKSKTGSYLSPSQVKAYLTNYGNIVTDSKIAVSKPRVNVGNAIASFSNISSIFPWAMFMPAMNVGTSTSEPLWGADSNVCCSISPYTFTLTSGGKTKRATLQTCSTAASWEGWQATTSGVKSFTWNTSGSCTGYSGSFSYTLNKGKAYRFRAIWTGTTVEIWVYTYNNRIGDMSNNSPTAGQQEVARELVEVIPLPAATSDTSRPAPQSAR
jgi:subtilisin family serine protease